MDNVTFIEVKDEEHAIVENADGGFTSMPKEEYDRRQAQQVEHLTEIIPSEAKTK